eukprot:TRINITY_DN18462_c0_g1_i1.p1 TRINITY_DN18462_c0_g1~~TRINITY_DN18462_c0_g1_i1.p1  ORF type:complete len:596 (+),score=115.71 TRINITY_DN18462_c0_g1_i1:319-2106(+)
MKESLPGNLSRWISGSENNLRFRGGPTYTPGGSSRDGMEADTAAAGPPSAGNAMEPKDSWLCPVCHEIIDFPVVTPCKHRFCKECLKKALGDDGASPPNAAEGQPPQPPRRCPICRSDTDVAGGVVDDAELRHELDTMAVDCGNPGCSVGPLPASEWKRHQEVCLHAEVSCWHASLGCHLRVARSGVAEHSKECAYGRLRPFIVSTNERIERLQHTVSSLEQTVRYQTAILQDLRSLHPYRIGDYFSFMWLVFCRPESYETTRDMWRLTFSAVWLQSLLLMLPILLVEMSESDVISRMAAPVCTYLSREADGDLLGFLEGARHLLLPAACGWGLRWAPTFSAPVKGVWMGVLTAALFVEGWQGTAWQRKWTHRLLKLAVIAAAPLIANSPELLAATVMVYVAAFALETVAGQHKFVALLWKEGVLATSACSPQGWLKLLVIGAMRVCSAWLVPWLRTAMRSVTLGPDLSPLRALLHRSDLTLAELFQSSVGTVVVLFSWWLVGWDMIAWYLTVVLCFFAFFALRLLSATMLQSALQRRGQPWWALHGCKLAAMWALGGLLFLLYHAVMMAAIVPATRRPDDVGLRPGAGTALMTA